MTILIPGFTQHTVTVPSEEGPIEIDCQTAGSGPPLLLLHGFPQTKAIWHLVAPELVQHYSVVVTDLRGYGASSKPHGKADHSTYSKRAMAKDQHAVMQALGHSQYFLVGHDRGGRVAHRLAADFPESAMKLMVLDISPTLTMYENTTMALATSYWHWFFLIQPEPVPETFIGANPEFWLKQHMGRYAGVKLFEPACWQEYIAAVSNPECLHAMCEDYRAAASIDLEHDRQDRLLGKKLPMPLKVLWGEHGVIERCFQPLADWQAVAEQVSGKSLACGHYIPEEMPRELIGEIRKFLGSE